MMAAAPVHALSRSAMPIRKWLVVLNYNVAAHSARQIDLLSVLPEVGLFIVDNASEIEDYRALERACVAAGADLLPRAAESLDGAVAASLQRGQRLLLCRNAENLGYSGGNNTALRVLHRLLGPAAEYLVLNPDVYVTPDVARSLLDSDAETAGPAIYERWAKRVTTQDALAVDFATGFVSERLRRSGRVSVLHGCCLKLSGRALAKYGFLPDQNFLYEEELCYFERVHRLGGTPQYLGHLQVDHVGKASTTKLSYLYFYYIFRNKLCYFREVGGPIYGGHIAFFWLYSRWVVEVLWYQARRSNWDGVRGLLRGVWHGLQGKTGRFASVRSR